MRMLRRSMHMVQASSGAWLPTSASVGVRAWYRPDLGTTVNTGRVQAINDQSGNGDAARNLVSSAGPPNGVIFTASSPAYNNQPIMTGNAADVLVSATGANWTKHPFAMPGALCIVGRSAEALRAVLSTLNVGGSGQSHNLIWSDNLGGGKPEQYNGATATRGTAVSLWNVPSMVMWTDDGTAAADAMKIYFNNLTAFEASRTTNFNVRSNGLIVEGANLSLFMESHGVSRAGGLTDIAEVIFFDGVPTATDRNNLRTYLNTRYALGIA